MARPGIGVSRTRQGKQAKTGQGGLARTLESSSSTRSTSAEKNGHCAYMARSSARPSGVSAIALSASPPPSHTGRCRRICVHAKTHGIARSVSMPPAALRLAGREPRFIEASADEGEAV
jgi:hypothetical protein